MAKAHSRVFFAIPCGGFYDLEAESIRRTAQADQIEHVIAEDDVSTKELWRKITASAENPSDLRGYVLQKYGSLSEFESRLGAWLSEATGASVPFQLSAEATRVALP